MPVVVLIGMLDVHGPEYARLRDRLTELGIEVVLVDTGVRDVPEVPPDIPREKVARAAATNPEAATRSTNSAALAHDTGTGHDAAISMMRRGAAEVTRRLFQAGRLDAALAIGGHGNSAISEAAMRALPDGVPKLMIDSPASDTGAGGGLVLLDDTTGLDSVPTHALDRAAATIARLTSSNAGLTSSNGRPATSAETGDGPVIGVTLTEITSEGVQAARELLSILGYEVLVFSGAGHSYETVASGGLLTAALDATPQDLSAELLGATGRPGPKRLEGAVRRRVPQVVSLGGLDVLHATGTPTRITPDEGAELGRRVAARLRNAAAPTALYIPLRGLSSLSMPGGPFHDPTADDALFTTVWDGLSGSHVDVHELDTDINDPAFGRAMADHLHATLTGFPVSAAIS